MRSMPKGTNPNRTQNAGPGTESAPQPGPHGDLGSVGAGSQGESMTTDVRTGGRFLGYSVQKQRPQIGWRLALQWTIANTTGWGAGLAFGFATVGRFSEIIGHALSPLSADLGIALVGAMVGAMTIPVGIMQWLVLRRQIDHAGIWVLASAVGWIIGLALGWSASMVLNESSSDAVHSAAMGAITGGIGGAVSGAMQWLVMRQEETASVLWLPASIIGWGAAFAAAWSVASLINRFVDLIATYAMIGIIVGGLGGAVTGVVLVWLLQPPSYETQTPTPA
jgi:hypothetical protein